MRSTGQTGESVTRPVRTPASGTPLSLAGLLSARCGQADRGCSRRGTDAENHPAAGFRGLARLINLDSVAVDRGRDWLSPTSPSGGRGLARRFRPKFVFPVGSLFRLRVSHHLGHATFPAPPRRTQHADFSHCALPFASPQEPHPLTQNGSGFHRYAAEWMLTSYLAKENISIKSPIAGELMGT